MNKGCEAVQIMKAIFNNIIRILLTSSVHCLKYPGAICTNIPESDAKCTVDNGRPEDQLVFAHVVSLS